MTDLAVTQLSVFMVSLFGGSGLLVLLLRRTFSDRDTHAAGYKQGREDTEDRYRRAFTIMIDVTAELVQMADDDRKVEAAMKANEALAALHRIAAEPADN